MTGFLSNSTMKNRVYGLNYVNYAISVQILRTNGSVNISYHVTLQYSCEVQSCNEATKPNTVGI
jgi:hypothetical protein